MFDIKEFSKILFFLPEFNRYVIAFSGGLDSSVLLQTCLQTLDNKKLLAIHINHGWHNKAARWAQHCQQICTDLNIACEVIVVDAKPKSGESPEAYARAARYAVFAQKIKSGDCLLTAHQQDDQAETLLLQMLRGAGINGLASMPFITEFAQGHHARPLLNFSRNEIAMYAQQQNLSWIEDESNYSMRYDRNFIRHSILSEIKKRWPTAAATLTRVAKHCAEAKEILILRAQQDLAQIQESDVHRLSIKNLLNLSEARRKNVIRYWLQQLDFTVPGDAQLQQIHTTILFGRKDSCPKVCWEGVEIQRYQDDIFASHPREKWDTQQIIPWDLKQPLTLPGLGTLSAQLIEGQGIDPDILKTAQITVRFRQGGERCKPIGRSGSHPLKKLFQEWHIPPWERDRIPLLYCDDKLAAVVNHCVCEGFSIASKNFGFVPYFFQLKSNSS